MPNSDLDLAVIGNGRTAALVDPRGRLVWWCFPRFDSDPVFCRLLAGDEEKGFTDVVLDNMAQFHSEYVRNTAVVTTTLVDKHGSAVRITDFAPRFATFGRIFRPPQLIRIVEPVAGLPRITMRCRPTVDYGDPTESYSIGSGHIRYSAGGTSIRLTTDAPTAYIERESPFVLARPVHLVLGPDEPFEGDLTVTCREFVDRTRDHWLEWVRNLSIGFEWQDAIIRAAISLRLSVFEETGGIVAALTTSIPDAPGSSQTSDRRFCWLREAYFVVKALNRIGATQTMEDFISFTLNLVGAELPLNPVYGVVPSDPMDEVLAPKLDGYRGNGPVRIGNADVALLQHGADGSVILAASPMFFDRRLPRAGDESLFRFLEPLGKRAAELALEPDAANREYFTPRRNHTYSAAICWAGCHRLSSIASHLGLEDRAMHWSDTANPIKEAIANRAWNEQRRAFTAAFGSEDLDAAVLQLPSLGLVQANDPRFEMTVTTIERELMRGRHVMRYSIADDVGLPRTAPFVCKFWLIDALWSLGRREDARDLFIDALKHRNHYGLLSEEIDPKDETLWGNFPQTNAMAALILTGMRLSRDFDEENVIV